MQICMHLQGIVVKGHKSTEKSVERFRGLIGSIRESGGLKVGNEAPI